MRSSFLLIASLGVAFAALSAQTAESDPARPDVDAIAEKLDTLYRSKSSHGRIRMKIVTPHYERELEMEVWSRGLDDTLVRILAPRKERGTSTLKRGREMWNYLPKIKKTIRIPPSMMMSGWMGSDFTNDDMVRESTWQRDYSGTIATESPPGQVCVEFKAKKEAAVAWDRVVTCVDAEEYYPVSQDFFDEKNRLARAMAFEDVRVLGGRKLPTRIRLTPLLEGKRGNETTVIYDAMEFDQEVPDTLFSLTRLRRGK